MGQVQLALVHDACTALQSERQGQKLSMAMHGEHMEAQPPMGLRKLNMTGGCNHIKFQARCGVRKGMHARGDIGGAWRCMGVGACGTTVNSFALNLTCIASSTSS